MVRFVRSTLLLGSVAVFFVGLAGCVEYTAPGGPADMAVMGVEPQLQADRAAQTGYTMQEKFDRKPLAKFPTAVAVARVQAPGYRSRTAGSHGQGAYSVVTTRDVETDEQVERLAKLPMVKGIAPLNRMLLPPELKSHADLRDAAASLQADVLVIYTLDTNFYVRDMAKPLSVVSLGLSPNQKARVTTTASAVVMDTRNGYVYGLAEASETTNRLASAWTNDDAVDAARLKSESAAFEKLVDELEKTWTNVVARYAKPAGTVSPTNVGG